MRNASRQRGQLFIAILASLVVNGVLLGVVAQLGRATPAVEDTYIAVTLAAPEPTVLPKPEPQPELPQPEPPRETRPARVIPVERQQRVPDVVPPPVETLPEEPVASVENEPAPPAPLVPDEPRVVPPTPVEASPVTPTPEPVTTPPVERPEPPKPRTIVEPTPITAGLRPTSSPGGAASTTTDAPSGAAGGTQRTGPGAASAPGSGGGMTTHTGGTPAGTGTTVSGPGTTGESVAEKAPVTKKPPTTGTSTGTGQRRGAAVARSTQPPYPRAARREGVEGTVVLRVALNARARVTDITVVESSGDRRLDQAAEREIRRWRFTPALEDGQAVASSLRVRIQFKLE